MPVVLQGPCERATTRCVRLVAQGDRDEQPTRLVRSRENQRLTPTSFPPLPEQAVEDRRKLPRSTAGRSYNAEIAATLVLWHMYSVRAPLVVRLRTDHRLSQSRGRTPARRSQRLSSLESGAGEGIHESRRLSDRSTEVGG